MSATTNVPRHHPRKNVFPGKKWCPHCERFLDISSFGIAAEREDGLSGWCRACRAATQRNWRAANPGASRAECQTRYRENPAKHFAKVAVARAVRRGDLTKPERCPSCLNVRRIEAHHTHGYERANWLRIVWRCRQCHKLEHTRGPAKRSVAA